jgi:hypothetical protein
MTELTSNLRKNPSSARLFHDGHLTLQTLCTRDFSSLVASIAELIASGVERTSFRAGLPPLWTSAFHSTPEIVTNQDLA